MPKAGTRRSWTPTSAEDRAALYEELEAILASEHFRSSARYPAFLRHVIEKALNGQTADLKERTLGIEVFHRGSDYNTADDPVVRVCGSEVRRRIAQYYQQSESPHTIEIELPSGGYVPQFWRRNAADPTVRETEPATSARAAARDEPATAAGLAESVPGADKERRAKWGWLAPLGIGVLITLTVIGIARQILNEERKHSPIMEVWNPFLTNANPVLISVGRPHPQGESELPPSPQLSIANRFFEPSYRVSITAVSAISEVAGFLETQQKSFQVHESDSNTLDDLHRRPLVLINGNDNKWTMLLLKPLRFHLDSVRDKGRDFSFVVDDQHPERQDWKVDFNQPFLNQTTDYALVGRFYCPTTESPVVVIAGISSNGTEAGGEFMASPEKLAALARETHNSLNQNFEAVLKVEVVGGDTGAATPLAVQFW